MITWASSQQPATPENLPPAPFSRDGIALVDCTLRQTVRVSAGGDRLRVRLANSFGRRPIAVTAGSLAHPVGGLAGAAAIRRETSRPLTFDGSRSVTLPAGARVVSDPVVFEAAPATNLSVTVHLADGQATTGLTCHPGSRTTSHLCRGRHVEAQHLPGAVATEHWYLLDGIETWAPEGLAAVVVLGDSLTDGRGSTTDGNDRWPDRLVDRLLGRSGPARGAVDPAVVNLGTGGSRVLLDGIGPSALSRLDRDVLDQEGIVSLVVFHGVNDIGTAEAAVEEQARVTADLVGAYQEIVDRARARGIRVHGATLLPFGGNDSYDDPAGRREATRQAVNAWIRGSDRFDAVIDFDRVVRDRARPGRLRADVDSGDHLHLNPVGYRMLADAVPLRLLDHRLAAPDPGDGAGAVG